MSDRPLHFQDEAADDHPSGAGPTQVDDHALGADPAAGEQTLGYLAYDELKVHSMSKSQANKVKANFDVVSKKDKLMWNQMCPKYLRKRPCLHGCKTFLMEIFAGCAVLTSVAHFAHGYPTSEPIDVLYDPVYDLTTAAGRAAVDERIARDDPYLLTFAPVCGPWSPWQHINMSKSEDMRFKVLEDRKKWLPVVKWICGHARKRLQRGRQVLIENPAPSAIWETSEMDKLLNHEEHYDQSTGEALEKINVDLCAFNSKDKHFGLLHKKRTGLVSKGLLSLDSAAITIFTNLWKVDQDARMHKLGLKSSATTSSSAISMIFSPTSQD